MELSLNTPSPRRKPTALLVFAGAMLFNLLFWQEQLAVNLLLFDGFMLTSLFYVYPLRVMRPQLKWLLAAHLVAVTTVLVVNTTISKLAAGITLVLVVAYTEYAHRSAWFAGGAMTLNFLYFIGNFFNLLRKNGRSAKKRGRLGRWLRVAIFPALLATLFFLVYQLANTVFAEMARQLADSISHWLTAPLEWFSIDRILFTALGFYICGALLLRAAGRRLERREFSLNDNLQRRQQMHSAVRPGSSNRSAKAMLGLKNENTVGIISLALLNLLLLTVNIIDIHYLWFHFSYTPGPALSRLIHEGTGMLIFSIVLAMLVLLFFFRGNLNFFTRNKWLKAGAFAWLVQNALLVVSVAVRDYYYIKLMGLAHKRIGVAVFLLLVMAGLVTVGIKIAARKTNYYLLRVNAWVVVTVLVMAATVDWELLIARYNIAHSNKIAPDLPYLLSLSDRTLPVLESNIAVLQQRENELNRQGIPINDCFGCITGIIKTRGQYYLRKQREYSWLSWNYADEKVKQYFTANRPAGTAASK